MPLNATQKRMIQEHAGRAIEKDDRFDSVESALEEVSRLIGWLGYVRESEFTDRERNMLILLSRKFAKHAQPIASKYLD